MFRVFCNQHVKISQAKRSFARKLRFFVGELFPAGPPADGPCVPNVQQSHSLVCFVAKMWGCLSPKVHVQGNCVFLFGGEPFPAGPRPPVHLNTSSIRNGTKNPRGGLFHMLLWYGIEMFWSYFGSLSNSTLSHSHFTSYVAALSYYCIISSRYDIFENIILQDVIYTK